MARTYAANFSVALSGSEVQTLDKGAGSIRHAIEQSANLPSGTADGQVNEIWSDTRTLAVGSENLELDNLTQLDSAGATMRTVAFAVVKGIVVRNTSASGRIALGGGTTGAGAADAFAGAGYPFAADASEVDIPFGGCWSWYDPVGVAVTNAATDILHVEAFTATQTYEIVIIGE